jgi:3-deoxy-D-manno-octulosonic-acid transferase
VKPVWSVVIFIVLWTWVNRFVVWPLLRLLALVSDRIRDQIGCRNGHLEVVRGLALLRQQFRKCVVFFCSSAGEYEQAMPLIEKFSSDTNIFCHVFFFSVSGARFVQSRNDVVSWSMSPVDDAERWGELFAALRPDRTFIVRHELWPSFLWAARCQAPVFVINAVVPSLVGRQSKWRERVGLAIKSRLLRSVDHVFAVSKYDSDFFMRCLHIPNRKITVSGDTKYDRVLDRALAKKSAVEELRRDFSDIWSPPECNQTLIGGSVHLPDVEWLLAVLSDKSLIRWKLLLVPHDVSTRNVGRIYSAVKSRGFSVELLSDIERAQATTKFMHPRVLIADEMGRLSELYGLADVAWVGGAVHNKVHNVLEPAARGLPVLCGPRYQNSQEAVKMCENGALSVAESSDHLLSQLSILLKNPAQSGAKSLDFAKSMTGATNKIFSALDRIDREVGR